MDKETKLLAYQAIDENVQDSTARDIIKWVMECELHGFDTIRPTNQYLAEHFGWKDETVRVAISKAKKSNFIATTGGNNNRTFELNVQFLKGKMAEIKAKRPLKNVLDFSEFLPNNSVLPNNLPNKVGPNNRGDSASNNNSNSKNNNTRVVDDDDFDGDIIPLAAPTTPFVEIETFDSDDNGKTIVVTRRVPRKYWNSAVRKWRKDQHEFARIEFEDEPGKTTSIRPSQIKSWNVRPQGSGAEAANHYIGVSAFGG